MDEIHALSKCSPSSFDFAAATAALTTLQSKLDPSTSISDRRSLALTILSLPLPKSVNESYTKAVDEGFSVICGSDTQTIITVMKEAIKEVQRTDVSQTSKQTLLNILRNLLLIVTDNNGSSPLSDLNDENEIKSLLRLPAILSNAFHHIQLSLPPELSPTESISSIITSNVGAVNFGNLLRVIVGSGGSKHAVSPLLILLEKDDGARVGRKIHSAFKGDEQNLLTDLLKSLLVGAGCDEVRGEAVIGGVFTPFLLSLSTKRQMQIVRRMVRAGEERSDELLLTPAGATTRHIWFFSL